jgi:hypothetical protein
MNGDVYVQRSKGDEPGSNLVQLNGAPVRPLGEVNHWTIVAKGPFIAVYINGAPVAFARDETYTSGNISLAIGANDPHAGIRVQFDNLKIWDISKLP